MTTPTPDPEVLADMVPPLVKEIAQILHGKGPVVQGAVFADLVSMWLAGHHADIRDDSLKLWIKTVRRLIPVNEAIILEQFGGQWPSAQ